MSSFRKKSTPIVCSLHVSKTATEQHGVRLAGACCVVVLDFQMRDEKKTDFEQQLDNFLLDAYNNRLNAQEITALNKTVAKQRDKLLLAVLGDLPRRRSVNSPKDIEEFFSRSQYIISAFEKDADRHVIVWDDGTKRGSLPEEDPVWNPPCEIQTRRTWILKQVYLHPVRTSCHIRFYVRPMFIL